VLRFLQTATPVPTRRPRTYLVEDLAASKADDLGPRKTPEADGRRQQELLYCTAASPTKKDG